MYVMGIDPTKVRTSAQGPEFRVGTLGCVNGVTGGPKAYVYVSGAVAGAGYVTLIDPTTFAVVAATTTSTAPAAGAGKSVGVGVAAIASGGYGWVQVFGVCSVRGAANMAAYTQLNSTGASGVVDDDASAGAEVIEGLVASVAVGGAEATTTGFCQWPRIGRTL